MDESRKDFLPNDYDAGYQKALKEVIDTLKNYGISITNEGILVPYSDEWDYLYDTPRRVLLKGNDKGESCLKLWESIGGELPKE